MNIFEVRWKIESISNLNVWDARVLIIRLMYHEKREPNETKKNLSELWRENMDKV